MGVFFSLFPRPGRGDRSLVPLLLFSSSMELNTFSPRGFNLFHPPGLLIASAEGLSSFLPLDGGGSRRGCFFLYSFAGLGRRSD